MTPYREWKLLVIEITCHFKYQIRLLNSKYLHVKKDQRAVLLLFTTYTLPNALEYKKKYQGCFFIGSSNTNMFTANETNMFTF